MKGMEGKKEKVGAILMQKYEVGRLLGQGTFAKVYHARNIKTGMNVAIKIINKEKVVKVGLIDQIKREISVMRLVKHPNVVRLYEVMASKTKIYFAMEYVKGGELFSKVARGRLKEDAARKYFQQLMAAVDFCHSRGVYHRDLKPENLLLDEFGNLKVSDFGLSALHDSRGQDGLLHTTCGTPAYVAPEVIHKKGYDGEKADIWSCGVILFVLLAGYLPFHDTNLMEMYKKISKAEFRCPHWFPPEVKKLLSRILDPNPNARMTLVKIMENSWFRKGFKEIQLPNEDGDDNEEEFKELSPRCILEIDHDVIDHHSDHEIITPRGNNHKMKPTCLNAFDIISQSQGFNLSGLFEDAENCKPESRFTTTMPPSMIVERLEEVAAIDSFKLKMKDGMVKMQGNKGGRKGLLSIDAQIFEVTPSLHVVEVKKRSGDTLEYRNFCDHELRPSLKDIAANWHQGCTSKQQSH